MSIDCAASFGVLPEVLDEDACRVFWVAKFWPAGPVCPECKVSATDQQSESFKLGKRICCSSCRHFYSWRSRTILSGHDIDARQLMLIYSLCWFGVSETRVSRSTELSRDVVGLWKSKLISIGLLPECV